MKAEDKKFLDSLDDELFIAHMFMLYGEQVPVWERCSQKEYEKYNGRVDSNKWTKKDLLNAIENLFDNKFYRAVPIYNNGGGILDQISGREPDSYIYEKLTGYKQVLLLGSEMFEYCRTRECMKPYFEELYKP